MENEENASLINKKAYEDQLLTFCHISFWSSHSILSLSHTLGHLDFIGALLESVAYLEFWSKKAKKEHEIKIGHHDQQLQWVFIVSIELHV